MTSSLKSTLRTVAITTVVVSGLWIVALNYWWLKDDRSPLVAEGERVTIDLDPDSPQPSAAGDRTDDGADHPAALPVPSGPARAPVRAAGSALIIPVAGIAPGQLIDTFTQARSGGARLHDAIDIMAPRGTPVVSAAEGTVEKLFLSDRGGKTVYVRSPDRRYIHYYAHLDQYAAGLVEGRVLEAGDPIGTVGSTGNASPDGPHLHFAIMATTPSMRWHEGSPINPFPLLTGR